MGGIGKSALAAETLATLAADPAAFPGGVTFVRCDGREGLPGLTWLSDQLLADWGSPLAPEQTAQAQIAGPAAEVELRERALQVALTASANGPALVLLDNVEVGLPLARALEILSPLGITALVTARHRPAVSRLTVVPLDVLDPTAAVQLFAERFRAQGGSWDNARDAEPTAQVVKQLDYTLAIELQAARAARGGMSVAHLNADLARDRSQGLLGDPTDATKNLRYSFKQSLRALTPLQRTRFAALGLPAGSDWPRDVIIRLFVGIQEQGTQDTTANDDTADDEAEPSASELASARADLDLLVALSLITPSEGRLRLHPLLREYARELWRAEPPTVQVAGLSALLVGIFDLADEYEHDFATLAQEEELIVAALDLAQVTQGAPQQLIAIVDALYDYLDLGGHWITGMQLRSWQLAACRAIGDRRREGSILNNLGSLADSLGQPEQARSYLEQALAIFQEIGAVDSVRVVANNLAFLNAPNTASSETPNALPAIVPEKPLPPKRRWPWQRKGAT